MREVCLILGIEPSVDPVHPEEVWKMGVAELQQSLKFLHDGEVYPIFYPYDVKRFVTPDQLAGDLRGYQLSLIPPEWNETGDRVKVVPVKATDPLKPLSLPVEITPLLKREEFLNYVRQTLPTPENTHWGILVELLHPCKK